LEKELTPYNWDGADKGWVLDAYDWGRLVDSDLASSLVCDAFSFSLHVV
jgi:hypothetical protein